MSNLESQSERVTTYYKNTRIEMLPFVPETCKIILEVGCGEGVFGKIVKSRQKCEYWGIDLNLKSTEQASKFLDKVLIGDFLEILHQLPEKYFDAIVFNDVIEHFIDPFGLLQRLKTILKPKGYVISSIPNVRFLGNLWELLIKKDWEYKNDGILDITHYRFFTIKSIQRMFDNAGYNIVKMHGINPTKNTKLAILNLLFFNQLSDVKFMQIGTCARLM